MSESSTAEAKKVSLSIRKPIKEYALFFIGQSGAGKETQVKKYTHLVEENLETKVLSVCTGDEFRAWIQRGTILAQSIKNENRSGKLQRSVYATHLILSRLDAEYTGAEHVVLDGSPRSVSEAEGLMEIFRKLSLTSVLVFIKVADDVARKRLKIRHATHPRQDTASHQAISEKLNFFHKEVLPAIEYMKSQKDVLIIEIDGNQGPDEVFEEIKKALSRL